MAPLIVFELANFPALSKVRTSEFSLASLETIFTTTFDLETGTRATGVSKDPVKDVRATPLKEAPFAKGSLMATINYYLKNSSNKNDCHVIEVFPKVP